MPRTKKAKGEKTKKKSETTLEKAEKAVKKTAKQLSKEVEETKENLEEKVKEIGEKVVSEAEKVAEDLTGKKAEKKEHAKKTLKKEEPKKISEEKEAEKKSEKEEKLAKLKEKAKKLESKLEAKEVDIIKKAKAEEEKAEMLVPIEDYLKSSIHLGTKVITPDMRPYIYKRRADSLAVFNTTLLDQKIKEGAEFLSRYAPEEVVVVCKREAGIKAVELFSKVTGIRAFAKKYPPGILTNPNLNDFLETELVIICDQWTDKAAMDDAKRIKIPVMAICDTNNYTGGVDVIVPGNNKSAKSLGMIFYLLAKLYVEKRKLNAKVPPISEWIEGWDGLVPPK